MTRAQFAPPSVSQPTGRHSSTNGLNDAVRTALKQLKHLFVVWKNRRAIMRLARHNDRMLDDIGLSRGDIDWALSHSLVDDPSLALAKRVARRRSAAQWARRPGLRVKDC